MATYVVTGAAGFIGSHLAEALIDQGHVVRMIDNFSTGKPENIVHLVDKKTDQKDGQRASQAELYNLDIRDLDGLRSAFAGADYVLHQAAIPSVPRSIADPITTHETCATGTLNVLVAARDSGVKRVIYAASSSAYGDADAEYKVESMPARPLSPYAVAKLVGEQYCQVFARLYDLETVCLRYFNVFGARQDPNSPYSAVIPLFITRMLRGERPIIYGDGTQSRDFTYIQNVVHGNLLACHAPSVSGEVINLACGDNISLLDLTDAINEMLGTDLTPIFADARPGDVRHSRADIEKARRLLGYEVQVPFADGLARTLASLRPASESGSA